MKARVLFAAVLVGLLAMPAAATAACSNEAFRQAQHATHLADCRAWEMVSPLDKANGDIVADGLTTIAARDGGAVAFNGRTAFADTVGSGFVGQTQYLARRGAAGWITRAITPMPRPDAIQTFAGVTKVQIFSDDLRRALIWGYDLPGATDDATDHNNIYLENTDDRSLRTVTVPLPGNPFSPFDFLLEGVWGLSDDARHVAFPSNVQLHPDAAPFTRNIYQWDDGVLSVAGILPDGTVPAEGSTAALDLLRGGYRRSMSSDGSRLLFASPAFGNQQLYQRIDGERTAWVSEPEGSDQAEPLGVRLQAATPDGRNLFFITDSALLDGDTATGPDLYRWTDGPDPEKEKNLTLISNNGQLEYTQTWGDLVVGVSDDGERVYYETVNNSLNVWDHGETANVTDRYLMKATSNDRLEVTSSQPGNARVTPDGRYLAFAVQNFTDDYDSTEKHVVNKHTEMYLYSLEDDELLCISCPSGTATSDVLIDPEAASVTAATVRIDNLGIRPTFLANDGRVFFTTREALLPPDVNGVADAYQFDPASNQLSILSSGKGDDPSAFLDASDSGDNVFVVTRQQLVGGDTDRLVDVYDARAGGGFPQPEPGSGACTGVSCQGASTTAPAPPTIASTGVSHGNVYRKRHGRCGKGKRQIRIKGKVRCVKEQKGGRR